jgi:Na+/alanine symporter
MAVDDFEHEPPRHRIDDSPDEDEDSVVRDRRAWASIRNVGSSAMDDSLLGDGEMENPWLNNRSGIEFGALAGIGITFSEEGFFNPNGTGTAATVFLIVNAALGAGLLNFPQSFDLAGGIATAVSVQAVLVVFVVTALWILAFSADWNQKASIITAIYPIPASPRASTMQEAMEGACGEWGRRLTSLAIVLYTFGTCITFIIIIGDQFDRTLASLYGHDFCHYWLVNLVT